MSERLHPPAARLFSTLDATWPAFSCHDVGPWTLRRGAGGGQRVSAATLVVPGGPVTEADVRQAADEMRAMDQVPLFMVRAGEDRLDETLARLGHRIVDPVVILAMDATEVPGHDPADTGTIRCFEPLAAMEEIWDRGGIGPDRRAIMARVRGPRTCILGRAGDTVASVVFAACDGDIAMVHALEVDKAHRRAGLGRRLTGAAFAWAREQGANTVALLVVRSNAAAVNLYLGCGMTEAGHYHYRRLISER